MQNNATLPILLCLIVGFGIVSFIGCQSDTVTNGASDEGVTLSLSTLFGFLDENLTEDNIIILASPNGNNEFMQGSDNTGILEGGVTFGQFTNDDIHGGILSLPLNKAPDPDCSVSVEAERKEQIEFLECVRGILDGCEGSIRVIREGDNINAYDNC